MAGYIAVMHRIVVSRMSTEKAAGRRTQHGMRKSRIQDGYRRKVGERSWEVVL
jgi:hypothetical protein